MPEIQKTSDDTVLVGKKPSMAYVMAAVTQFNSGKSAIYIKGRGKANGKCIDVAEIVRNKFFKDVFVKNISIGTEQVPAGEGSKSGKEMINVSTIEIVLSKR